MAVLPSSANTSNPQALGYEANLDDLFLRYKYCSTTGTSNSYIRNTRRFSTGVWSNIFKSRFFWWIRIR